MKGGYDEETVIKPLALMAEQYGCHECSYEANWGDSMFGTIAHNVFKKHAPSVSFDREGIKVPNTQKEVRIIDVLEPVLNFHKLIIDRRVVEDDARILSSGERAQSEAPNYMWQYQMSRLTHERGCLGNDDRIDVLHLGVKYLQDMLLVDAQGNIEDRIREEEEAEEAYIERQVAKRHGTYQSPNELTWGYSLEESLFTF
jgi:hypothetical protein